MRVLPRLLAVLGLFGPLAGHRLSMTEAFRGAGEPLQVITTLTDGLILEWQVPKPEIDLQADGTVLVEIPGYGQLSRPGAPRLPFTSVLVAIPPGVNPSLEIVEMKERELLSPGPLDMGKTPQGVIRSSNGTILGGAFSPPAEEISFEPDPVTIEPLGEMRGVHLARVVFYPLQGKGADLKLVSKIRAAVHLGAVPKKEGPDEIGRDPILQALQSAVANPEALRPGVRTRPASLQNPFILESQQPFAAFEVDRRGLTAVTLDVLVAAGVSVEGINPPNLKLTRAGVEIPYEWDGDGDSQFEVGERLLFYADPRFSRWTPRDVYFLSQAGTPAALMSSRSADPSGLPVGNLEGEALIEENKKYTPDCFCAPIPPGRDGDRWVWEELNRPGKSEGVFPFELESIALDQQGNLTLWMIGYTNVGPDPDHRVSVSLNGTALGEITWDGKQAVSQTLPIPAQVLMNGSNSLALTLPGLPGVSIEGVWLDAFSVKYSRDATASGNDLLFWGEKDPHSYLLALESSGGLRAYDVSDPMQPARLTGLVIETGNKVQLGDPAGGGVRTYYVTIEAGISTPSVVRKFSPIQAGSAFSGADYLVIAHPDFIPAIADLVDLRQDQGLSAHLEEIQAIYDNYGDGRPEPAAIRAYLETAYLTWETRPSYLLLLGDGTYDPRQYLADSARTFVPPFLAEVDPWAGETAADNRYVTLEGEDNLPDMLVGRLPVNSEAEAQAIVDKIVRYETQPAPGSWPGNAIVAADDPDDGGDFPFIAETMLDPFNGSHTTPQRYYFLPGQTTASEVRQDILSAWNAGSAVAIYTGHASIHQWAAESFLHLEDVSSLQNGNRLPLVLEMTCFTSSFQIPGFATLDEALLRLPGSGAVATWGATGLGIATGHATLAESFLEKAIGEAADFGSAALAGKMEMAIRNPDHMDLVDTFTLLGDPATKLNLTVGVDLFHLPLIQK